MEKKGIEYLRKYYPHTWGWSLLWKFNRNILIVLPTHVGVILWIIKGLLKERSTTHTRGGDPTDVPVSLTELMYYPHTWGWSWNLAFLYLCRLVLPTHVGVILSCFFSHFFKCCTTHTRGGDPNSHYKLCFQNKYYPHTWGWSQSTQRRYLHYLVLPTHVGVILFDKFFNLIHVSTTHTRGGDPKNGLGFSSTGVYYPHTWGWS